MTWSYGMLAIVLTGGMLWSTLAGKLTLPGALCGGLIGFFVYAGAGFTGLAMMAVFFLLGTLATSWKLNVKQKLGLAEENKSGRTAGQVIANAGVAGLLGVCVWIYPKEQTLFVIMMAASLASATADTLSSELGNVYGRKFYNIIGFRKDERGLNGVISIEGTLFGIAGSIVIGLIYTCTFGLNPVLVMIVISGTIGNLADSLLGATVERRRYLNNDAVNFLNTLIAAFAAWGMFWCL